MKTKNTIIIVLVLIIIALGFTMFKNKTVAPSQDSKSTNNFELYKNKNFSISYNKNVNFEVRDASNVYFYLPDDRNNGVAVVFYDHKENVAPNNNPPEIDFAGQWGTTPICKIKKIINNKDFYYCTGGDGDDSYQYVIGDKMVSIIGNVKDITNNKYLDISSIEIFNTNLNKEDNKTSGFIEYKNSELGFSINIPDSCGNPTMNQYYKYFIDKVIQGIFLKGCPVQSFSAKVPGTPLDNDDTSFGPFKGGVVSSSKLNFTTKTGVKGVVTYEDPNTEMGDPNTMYYTFNTTSTKYPSVTFVGSKLNTKFLDAINTLKFN